MKITKEFWFWTKDFFDLAPKINQDKSITINFINDSNKENGRSLQSKFIRQVVVELS